MGQKRATSDLPTEANPYLDARREWNERYGSYIARARTWRTIAVLTSLAAVAAVIGIAWIGAQNKFVPYVVQVDKLGAAVAVAPAERANMPDIRVVKAQLAEFIANLRTVSPDVAVERQLISRGYAMVATGTPAYTTLNEYFKTNNPLQTAQTETIQVEVQSVLPLSDKTFQVEWHEEHRAGSGDLIKRTRWKAAIEVGFNPPTDEAGIMKNPLGVFVTNIQWSQQL